MKIAATQYTLETESFEIYISGCDGVCGKHCHNPELWDFNIGVDYELKLPKILSKIKEFDTLIKWIWILGGEPLLQDKKKLIKLLKQLKKTNKPVVLFTRFELQNIPKEIIKICDYIKTGKYIKHLTTNNNIQYGIKLSTSNQQIHKIDYGDIIKNRKC